MFKKLRWIATTRLAGIIIYYLARMYSATFRMKVENEEEWLNYLDKGGRVLVCAWHQQFFIGVRLFARYKKYSVSVMVSKSLDGEISSQIAKAANVFPIRGSSSRNGGPALREMISRLKQNRLAVLLPDGPRGPAGVVKAGAIAIASGADAAIVPGYIKVDRAWLMNSWDKFIVPKPFAHVTVNFCPMMKLPPIKDDQDFEKQRQMLEDTLKPYLRR